MTEEGNNRARQPDMTAYHYDDGEASHATSYLWPRAIAAIAGHLKNAPHPRRVFEVGCGNGAFAAELTRRGYEVIGVDPSTTGIAQGRRRHPEIALHAGSAYEPLRDRYGTFSVVVSLEVIEHVYAPRTFAATIYDLVEPGGIAILSTPYHGYLKNLALAVSGSMDKHFTALWDHGHIKFWSSATLGTLLREAGFEDVTFARVGRIAPLAKAMIAIATK